MTKKTKKNKEKKKRKSKLSWPVQVFFLTLVITLVLSFLSETTLIGVSLPVAVVVLFVIILIGVLFDILGVSVTLEEVSAYNAMASKRLYGSKEAIKLLQNAPKISNICNDVVGDICGIVSGAMGAAIAIRLIASSGSDNELLFNVAVSSLIAAITVSSKAFGKHIATINSRKIVLFFGKCMAFFSGDRDRNKPGKVNK